ncbi:MAG TPA: glycosyltransferase [Bacteroidia bacterium]|nr:glycosyltransferase [Bacteroidia bacterium]
MREQEINKPIVTVLMAVYNGERYLKESIESILGQTFKDFEFLIINDGSTDSSPEIINSFSDSRIRLINNPVNIGVINALNLAVDKIQGEYVARMDCDDICAPQRLEKEVAILKSNLGISVVASHVSLIDTEGKETGFWPEDIHTNTNEEIYRMLPYENCIANPTVMLRTALLKKYRYNSFQKSSEDWDLWLRMATDNHKFYKINEALVKYRIHSSSITAGFNRKSVFRKKNSIQFRYFWTRISKGRLNKFDIKVLKNGFINYCKYVLNGLHPSILPIWARVRTTNLIKVLGQFYRLFVFCNFTGKKTSVYFFFPYYHIGGAEKVHIDIMEAVADKKPVCFITGISSNNGFYEEFKSRSSLIDISLLANYPGLSRISKNMISKLIGSTNGVVTFGCNSKYYYDLLPYFKQNVKCIDLIHAFVHPGEDGAEYWSLPVIERIDNRIVINKKTIEDYKSQYRENHKNENLLSRIKYIPNCTNVPPAIRRIYDKRLKILFVGRNGKEKRIYLIGKIAGSVKRENIQADFELVGDVETGVLPDDRQYCTFRGEISDENEMQKIYESADILLLTSTREGFPMVIMEAMANRLVVITTDVGGIRDHITNGENGILISSVGEENLIKDFTSAIKQLALDRGRLKELSLNAYSYAKLNFNKQNFRNAYRSLLLPNE